MANVAAPDTSRDAAIAAALAAGKPAAMPKQRGGGGGGKGSKRERRPPAGGAPSNKKRTSWQTAKAKARAQAMRYEREAREKGAGAGAGAGADEPTLLISRVPRCRLGEPAIDGIAERVCLSRAGAAHTSCIRLSDDLLRMSSTKGYRMCRATHGVEYGRWYFEITIATLGPTGHSRLGWASHRAELHAPVGYDANSYAYRDVNGMRVHAARRKYYGEPYAEGDVIGCLVVLPPRAQLPRRAPLRLCKYKREVYAERHEGDDKRAPLEGACVAFYKNGVCQGVAYEGLAQDVYFPAGSLYTDAAATGDAARPASIDFNFGPSFKCAPEGVEFASRPWDDPAAPGGGGKEQEKSDVPQDELQEQERQGEGAQHGECSAEEGAYSEPQCRPVSVDGKSVRVDGVLPMCDAVHFKPLLELGGAPPEELAAQQERRALAQASAGKGKGRVR